jgi:small subunit ribosomal protein S16
MGKTHNPHYRIVVMEARSKREGESVEELGHYSPLTKELVIDKDKVKEWMQKGAQPTDSVRNVLVRNGILDKPKYRKIYNTKPGKRSEERRAKKEEKQQKPEPEEVSKDE